MPAYFNDAQRQATKDAGTIADLQRVLRIINEPTAASLAYGLDKQGKEELIAVYDLGGGTFDISILRVGEGVFEVIATNGDTFLSGDDFDEGHRLGLRRVSPRAGDRPAAGPDGAAAAQGGGRERPRSSCRAWRRRRSTCRSSPPTRQFKHLALTLTRAKLEQLTADLVGRTRQPVLKALEDANLQPAQVDEVVLVGGMTRIPAVQEMVKKLFGGKEPHKGVNPDEVVAIGAAIQAGVLKGEVKDVLLLDVTPLSLGVETLGGVMTTLIAQHDHPDRQDRGLLDRGRRPAPGRHPRPAGRAGRWRARTRRSGASTSTRSCRRRAGRLRSRSSSTSTNGILNVSARDKTTGKEQKITIQASSGLSRRRSTAWSRTPRPTPTPTASGAGDRGATRPTTSPTRPSCSASRATDCPSHVKQDLESQVQGVRKALESGDAEQIKTAAGELEGRAAGWSGRLRPAVRARCRGRRWHRRKRAGTVEGEFREV